MYFVYELPGRGEEEEKRKVQIHDWTANDIDDTAAAVRLRFKVLWRRLLLLLLMLLL